MDFNRIKDDGKYIINFDTGKVILKKYNREVGYVNSVGYLVFNIKRGKVCLNHRYIYEQFHNIVLTPQQHINHINHNTLDNRIDNLNLVDNQRNIQYSRKQINNTSGFKSVYWNKQKKKWICKIRINYKFYEIDRCDNKEDANELYKQVCRYLNDLGFYYHIEGEEVVLKEDNRHLFDEENFKEFIKSIRIKKLRNYKGCVWLSGNRYRTQMTYRDKKIYVGTYDTKEQGEDKLKIVVDYINKHNQEINVEDLKNFVKSIR